MPNSAEIRQDIINALQLDLIGPPPNTTYIREILPVAPSLWYLTGFLVPFHAPLEIRTDDTANDELDQLSLAIPGDDETTPEKTAARKGFFPSSIGLSFFLPETTKEVEVIVTWGDYFPEETEAETEEENCRRKLERKKIRHLYKSGRPNLGNVFLKKKF